ncbi:hypothetical protein ACI2IY_21065 [Lysobacter enzymogenes]|uniref:hypothetical protein n=1 Tax=Lysobacter enzymogenes TaxID=69 RepID=UPI003850A864
MFAQTFRFADQRSQWTAFQSRMRSAFEPRKPRHRLLRFVLGVIGLGLLALLVFFSVFVGAAMIAVGLAYRLWRRRGQPMTARAKGRADVVEGEFRVVAPRALPRDRNADAAR